MPSKVIDGIAVYKPTRQDILDIQIGDMLPDAFGRLHPVESIHARREDINGNMFVCLYLQHSPTSKISDSYKEGKIHPSLDVISKWNRCELVPW